MAKKTPFKIAHRVGLPDSKKPVQGLFLGVFEDDLDGGERLGWVDEFCTVKIRDLLKSGEISGKFKEFHVIHLGSDHPVDRVVLIGLGSRDKFTRDTVRSTAAKAARTCRKLRCESMAVFVDAFGDLEVQEASEAVVEGAILGLNKFQRYLKETPEQNQLTELVLLCEDRSAQRASKVGAARGQALADATNHARVLANTPPNFLGPKDLVSFARDLSKRHKTVTAKVHGEKALEKMGAGGILAVGQGSTQESYLIDLYYKGGKKGCPEIALVGKGVTFDTGGISIKPSAAMHRMKYDMGGAAAVLGAMDAIASLGLPINVRGIVPTAENMPDGNAYKPGDVLKMLSGHFVEVLNTDAEGRLLLADGIWYAAQKKPDLILDVATLTGHIILALGHTASGVFSNRAALPNLVIEAGKAYNEKFWHMPLFPEYRVHISSTVADITNDGGRPAGSSSAAKFLETFTDGVPWAHLDIAGTAWIEESRVLYVHKPYLPDRGATGFGVRTLASFVDLVSQRYGKTAKARKELQTLLEESSD